MIAGAFNYKIWAGKRTLRAVGCIDNSIFPESYKFALQQINHRVIVEELFKSRLEKNSPPHINTNSAVVPELNELEQRLLTSGKWYSKYASGLSDKVKRVVLSFTFADGKTRLNEY